KRMFAQNRSGQGDSSDLVSEELSEPDRLAGARADADRPAAPGWVQVAWFGRRRDRHLNQLALYRDAPDVVAEALREPQVAVRSHRDLVDEGALSRNRKLGHTA